MEFRKALSYNIILKSINVLILFFSNILFVRIVGADITGEFFYLITVLSFITLITSFSLESGITYYVSGNTNNISSFALFNILLSVFQILLSFLVISVIVKTQTTVSLIYLLLFVISNILISNFSALYISQKWFISVNTVILVINLITLSLYGLLLMQQDLNFINIAQKIYIASFSVQAIILIILFFIKSKVNNWSLPSANIIKKVFRYSLISLIGNISFFLVTRLDYVFVKTYCTPEELGNYIQVSKLGQLFVLLPTMAASVIFPYAAMNNENILSRVQGLCRLMTIIIITAAIFITLFGKWIFPWLFGNDFTLMYTAILFYLPGIFSLCVSSLLASYISGKGHIITNVMASLIALAVVIAGDILLIPIYGINAAAAVSSVAYSACLFFLLRHLVKKHDSKLSEFFSISFTEVKYFFSNKKIKHSR